MGHTVVLSELALRGLREESEKTLAGRTVQCPSCGAAIAVRLATTQSVVCSQCKSVIDLTSAEQGNVGADLAHYAQAHGSEPQIPLGSVGTLSLGRAALPWQVVGYVERCEVPQGDDDEQTFWREYLLYHRSEGFAFLVDAEDGWSWTAPITGAPQSFGESVKHEGVLYRKLYDYVGKVTYVLGEFYWRLERDERTANTDYVGTGAASNKRLNREETRGEGSREVVWSARRDALAPTRWWARSVSRPTSARRCSATRCRRPSGARRSARSSSGCSSPSWWRSCSAVAAAAPSPIAARRARPTAKRRRSTRIASAAGAAAAAFAAAAARSAAFRLAAGTSEARRAHGSIGHAQENFMNGIEWLKPAVIIGSVLYALIGVLIFWIAFILVDKLTPYRLWDEIVEKKNLALAIVVGSMCIAIGLIVAAAVHG